MSLSLLVVDDDAITRETITEYFSARGYAVRTAGTATEGRRTAAEHAPDVALVDLRLPDADGLRLVEALLADDADLAVIVITGHADVSTAVRAMRLGATDLIEKPVDLDVLRSAVERASERGRLRRELYHLRERENVGENSVPPALEKLIELAARNTDVPVLILGESGTGKSVVARRIHDRSSRAQAPFVVVNCASLAPQLLESELFGHERGAFTDARSAKRGLLEVAGHGTLLLDEIGELAPAAQPKLLTVIEDGIFRRLGGTTELHSDARIIAATNTPLREAVTAGRFRADLFYRLQVLTIEIAPLRHRPEDIARLTDVLLPRGARLSDSGRRAVESHDWPGNVRELKHALWRAALLADGSPITASHLALGPSRSPGRPLGRSASEERVVDVATIADAERRAIVDALQATGGNKQRAARILGIARSTLIEKVRRFGLT